MATVVMPEIGNNGLTLLNGAINASVTTINVDSAAALTLDNSTTDAYITVIDPTTFGKNPFSTPETQEIMQVTNVSTNVLTVVRGVDGTSGTEFADNSYVMLRNNAATLQRVYDALTDGNDTLDVAGVSGDFDVGGDLTLGASGVNKIWTKWVGAKEMGVPGTNGADSGTYEVGEMYLPVLDFDSSTNEFASFNIHLGDDHDDTYSLTFKIHWTAATLGSGTDNVYWIIESGLYADSAALSTVMGSPGVDVDNIPTAGDLMIADAISGVPGGAGDWLVVRITRNAGNAADTLESVDARLIGVEISYT
jgi:hypothetical protein